MDAELCADPATLEGLGDRALVAAAKRVAYRLDPHAVVDRARRAVSERRISVRPAPDTMAYLTGLLPVAQAVACYAALGKAADALLAFGDPRTRGQLMADLAVERMTGQSGADGVPVTVHLVMTDRTLLQGDGEPAFVPGYGPVPAGWARDLLRPTRPRTTSAQPVPGRPDTAQTTKTARRPPRCGCAGCSPIPRPGSWSRWSRGPSGSPTRCASSWCCATRPAAPRGATPRSATATTSCPTPQGGATSAANGQGLCEACNYTKEAPGWAARPTHDSRPGRHQVEIITPTGHRYRSRPPPQPGDYPQQAPSRIEVAFTHHIHAA